jgi:GxxExxY protein
MPVRCDIPFKTLSEKSFLELDYKVRHFAFEAQNELGRLCDEAIYQADLALRLETSGLGPARREAPVVVWHEDFAKTYYLDCVVQNAALYELKAVSALTSAHPKQVLNYLYLLDQPRGVLLNFRPSSLEHRFVSTKLTLAKRRAISIDDTNWRRLSQNCETVRARLLALLQDWGAFLELSLYQEALAHFLGGAGTVFQPMAIRRNGQLLGTQTTFLLNPNIALRLTAQTTGSARVKAHLRRLLQHTDLQAIQWVNLNHEQIEFVTITH